MMLLFTTLGTIGHNFYYICVKLKLDLLRNTNHFIFSNFFTPTLKGEVAENQAPFRDGVKLIFSIKHFSE